MWFLREWKRVVPCLMRYEIALVCSVIVLEWHYVVDLLEGAAVAFLSILVVDGFRKDQPSFCSEMNLQNVSRCS